MSLEAEVADLRIELAETKEEVASLRSELDRLRKVVAGIRSTAGTPARGAARGSSYAGSEDSYSLVADGEGVRRELRVGGPAPASPSTSEGGSLHSVPFTPGGTPLSWAERERICDSIGAWAARALRGEHRGSSGRDRNPLASRIFVTIRDYQGIIYDPPLVHRSFSSCKVLVKRGSDTGDSIFFGIPSQQEAQRAIQSAGLRWSGVIEN